MCESAAVHIIAKPSRQKWKTLRGCRCGPDYLEPRVQVGRLSGHQAFRTRANMHNSVQMCHPEVTN